MDTSVIFATIGFLLAAYSVVGNDGVQTLGTFIASNNKFLKWYWLWLAAALVMIFTVTYGWYVNGGDISYGRLNKIPEMEIKWYHAAAPLILVLLTRYGIPVSTTFLVLSTFATSVVLEKMLIKSVIGYSLAAIVAYGVWMILSRIMNEKYNKVKKENRVKWRILQWFATGFLWYSWLSHDMANIAVFLPRQLPLWMLIGTLAILCSWLAVIFYTHGGKIQQVVLEKSGTRFIRSATIIDFVYALILLYFKQMNDIPMSTTWVFVGLLTGRELAIATTYREKYKFGYVFPLIGKDFMKMMVGLAISVGLVLMIHYVLNPTEFN